MLHFVEVRTYRADNGALLRTDLKVEAADWHYYFVDDDSFHDEPAALNFDVATRFTWLLSRRVRSR